LNSTEVQVPSSTSRSIRVDTWNLLFDCSSAGEEDGVTEGWNDLKTLHGDQQLIQSLLFDDQVKVRERICNVTQQLQDLEAEGNQLEAW